MVYIKDPVKLRQRERSRGGYSLYLDITINGKRTYEYLKLYLVPENNRADKLKNKETFEELKKVAEKYGAKIGASRKAIEKGLADKKYQIGQTGQNVAPKIYVAVGISGAIQHVSGIENSKTIVAVNPDINAQIHQFADYSIYQDAQTFISEMLNQH